MTLIQTLLTPAGIIQVSDRQLTYRGGKIHEEPVNKAVLWCGAMTVGFSGMAFTDKSEQTSISEWICTALRSVPFSDQGLETFMSAAAELVSTTDIENKGLTFSLAGIGAGKALGYVVSNSGNERVFRYVGYDEVPIGEGYGKYRYVATGANVSSEDQKVYCDKLSEIHWNHGASHTAGYMVGIQRRIRSQQLANTRRSTVGRAAMIVSLPPNPSLTMMTDTVSHDLSGLPSAEFSFVGDWGFSRKRFGPHYVCGSTVGLNFEASAEAENPNNQRASITLPFGL